MNISELLNSSTGQNIIDNISNQFGLDKNQAVSAVNAAIPMILGGLGRNAQTNDGAQGIENALQSKHNGSILDNVNGFFNMGESAQKDGSGILGHIFGDKVGQVENGVAQKSGISLSKIGPIVAMLAPIVMGYLGKQKNQQSSGGGIADILGQLAGGGNSNNSGGGLIGMVTGFLDKDGDGNIMDDIMGMFGKK